VKPLFNFLAKLFFLDVLFTGLSGIRDRTNKQFKDIKPFSWQTALGLSLLSWIVFVVVRDPYLKKFVSIYGWAFLILGVDWYYVDDKEEKKKLYLPGLDIKVNYGSWLTGALFCLALLTNDFLLRDAHTALVAWPIVSVLIASLTRILRPGLELNQLFRVPQDANTRQDLVILFLFGLLFSCWFQFHFLLQDVIQQYPSILADDFRNSAFVSRLNPRRFNLGRSPESRGAIILDTAEDLIRNQLSGQSWLEVQRRLRNLETQVADLGDVAIARAYEDAPEAEERQFWRFNAIFEDKLPDDSLELQAIWTGPSSQPTGYALRKVCSVRRSTFATVPNLVVGGGQSFELNCQPITSPFTETAERERL
jgi:hypothetical protein